MHTTIQDEFLTILIKFSTRLIGKDSIFRYQNLKFFYHHTQKHDSNKICKNLHRSISNSSNFKYISIHNWFGSVRHRTRINVLPYYSHTGALKLT